MAGVELLGFGREADVYALDSDRVLRRYRRGDDASGEAELMEHLHGLGFPVPRVHQADGADLILERLDGATMTETFRGGGIGVDEGAAILVALHQRLHALPARHGRRDGDRIQHRDLHPDNVMLTSRGPVVIDWHNAAEGPPEVDVCLTAIILAQAAAAPGHPHAGAAAAVLTPFLRLSGAVPGQAGFGQAGFGDPMTGFDEAIGIRRTDPALSPAESDALAATVTPLIRAAISEQSGPAGGP